MSNKTRCHFIGGPLDGLMYRVKDRVQIFHCPNPGSDKPLAYYRSVQASTLFFRDITLAGWRRDAV